MDKFLLAINATLIVRLEYLIILVGPIIIWMLLFYIIGPEKFVYLSYNISYLMFESAKRDEEKKKAKMEAKKLAINQSN